MRFILLLSLLGVVGTSTAYAAEKPNVLIIMADDCTHTDLPLYGGQNAKTPNLDALAAQSLTFNKAYVSSAMCQPCRAELFTGKYPMQNGCAWNHSASRPDVTSMPHHMQKLGYRVGIAGKVHVKPDSVFPFESVPGFDPSCVREPTKAHDLAGVTEFMNSSQPFCLVVALRPAAFRRLRRNSQRFLPRHDSPRCRLSLRAGPLRSLGNPRGDRGRRAAGRALPWRRTDRKPRPG